MIPCTSCKTSYNVLRQFVGAGEGSGGVGDIRGLGGGGGVVQNRESPDFRSPEVGRYVYLFNASTREKVMRINKMITQRKNALYLL